AEELAKFLAKAGVRCRYIHSGIDTLDRVEIIRDLRIGKFDVLVGVNLLREGLDLPEVSLVAIIDADKEGFLRDRRSMIQTAGRAARNVNGKVIFYADKITKSMQATLDETQRRRTIQTEYNQQHNITPTSVKKSKADILKSTSVLEFRKPKADSMQQEELVETTSRASLDRKQWQKEIENRRKAMRKAAKNMDFLEAARLRDEVFEWEKAFEEKYGKS
ncbi:MAG TPA: excinuclease ABC subunit B, partial [Bacteroidetes bacterium]|nr:excinuclease ABC subunit B [Bacteroidota bacterium]